MNDGKLTFEREPLPADSIVEVAPAVKSAKKAKAKLPRVGHKRAKVKRSGKLTQQQRRLKKVYQQYKVEEAAVGLPTAREIIQAGG